VRSIVRRPAVLGRGGAAGHVFRAELVVSGADEVVVCGVHGGGVEAGVHGVVAGVGFVGGSER